MKSSWSRPLPLAFALVAALAGPATITAADAHEVLVYPTIEDGSNMHWLAINPLQYDIAYLGDSLSADVLSGPGTTELTTRPKAGDRLQGIAWRKMHFPPSVAGPSMANLFLVCNHEFNFAITCCVAYIYSPVDHPTAIFSGSADDGLKVVINGKKLWSNQIQRSPTYDSDQFPAPLLKGWNTVVLTIDQAIGGHIVCARFLDNGQPIKDLEIALDPPTADAVRHPADAYNQEALTLVKDADADGAAGKLTDAITGYDQVLTKYPLSDIAPRAEYAKAMAYYNPAGTKSLGDAQKAVPVLKALLDTYSQDLLAEYALIDLATIQETALKDAGAAQATYRSMEERYPDSSLLAKAGVAIARLLAASGKYEDSVLAYRKVLGKYPQSDEVMNATIGIGDTEILAGDKAKATAQYQSAMAMAQEWHDNKYGIDVGKQAWLQGLIDALRQKLQ